MQPRTWDGGVTLLSLKKLIDRSTRLGIELPLALHGVGRAGNLVFGAQDQIKAVPGGRQTVLADCPRARRLVPAALGPAQRIHHSKRSRRGRD